MLNLLRYFHKSYWRNKTKLYTLIAISVGALLLSNIINSAFSHADIIELHVASQVYTLYRDEFTSFYYLNSMTAIAIPLFELLYIGAFLLCHFYRQNQVYICLSSSYTRKSVLAALYIYACLLASLLTLAYAFIFAISNLVIQMQAASKDYYEILIMASFEICLLNCLFIALMLLLVVYFKGNYLSLLLAAFIYILAIGIFQNTDSAFINHLTFYSKLPFSIVYNTSLYEGGHAVSQIIKSVNFNIFWSLQDYFFILIYLGLTLHWANVLFQKQDI